ncbi:hypothetical protein ACO0LG_01510 [Undibacterium sp. Ji42W]|uniref:hypothetical protein n=1 Tax=Undibacterium sp. Ji42W TaxID=3413039 RepID=UPI003BF014F7
MNFNPEIIDALRKRSASGEKPSALLKHLGSEYPDDRGLGFTAMKYFREAFGLSLRQVLSIPDWVHGGISDERVDEYLLRELRVFIQTAESAQQAALVFLSNGPFADANPVLAVSNIQEFDEGWVFLYQSASFFKKATLVKCSLEIRPSSSLEMALPHAISAITARSKNPWLRLVIQATLKQLLKPKSGFSTGNKVH